MKTINITIFFAIIGCCSFVELQAQEATRSRMAILPLHANGIDSVSLQTAESILRTEIGKLSPMEIVSSRRTVDALDGRVCAESECALEIGRKLEASQVLGCRLSPLGEKIIVQYFLVDLPANREILIDQITALTLEDLEVLMKRVAKSVVNREPIEKNAEVGKILGVETKEPERRASRNNFGFSFGYLYPQKEYDNSDRIFVVDVRFDHELQDYAVGMLLGIRKGFAMNLYGSYLFLREDLCPYVGGALGFHWVSHSNFITGSSSNQKDMRGDGFELTGNAGIRVMHTYDFQLIFNLEYIYTINDYKDQALVFTIGIL